MIAIVDKKIKSVINSNDNEEFSLLMNDSLYRIIEGGQNLEKEIVKEINNVSNLKDCTFCSGLAGFGWYLTYLIENEVIDYKDVEDIVLEIDTLMYKSTIDFFKNNNHDFLHGGLGCAYYLINRAKYNPNVKNDLNDIINNLLDISHLTEKGYRYWNESSFIKDKTNMVNLGLAHGQASKIVFFSKIFESKLFDEVFIKEILLSAVDYLLSYKRDNSCMALFPNYAEDNPDKFYRLSWCYSDLGISIALWQAGLALQDKGIKQEAVEICLHTTKRKTPKETGVVDAGICHGTAGIAHIYNRMYRSTKKIEFKEATNYWINETLKMSKFSDGLAGYKTYRTPEFGGWQNRYGLLDGIAGIGLVLKSYVDDDEPTWDSCLLLS